MRIYFVRHGQSEENISNTYIGAHAKVTEEGLRQAQYVGKRFEKIPVDIILSSDMARAKETARVISERVGQPVTYSELLQEGRAPSELLGKDPSHPEVAAIRELWLTRRYQGEHMRYSDEETIADMKTRAGDALAFIANHEADNILVVTHGTFLRVVLGMIIIGDTFSPQLFKQFRERLSMSNTGITVCDYHKEDARRVDLDLPGKSPGWRLITWNDHAHLG